MENDLIKMKRLNVCQLMADFVCPDVQYYMEKIVTNRKIILYEHAGELISLLQFLQKYVPETKVIQLFFYHHLRLFYSISSSSIITVTDSNFDMIISWLPFLKSSTSYIWVPTRLMRAIESQLNTFVKCQITMGTRSKANLIHPRAVLKVIRVLVKGSKERKVGELIQSLLYCHMHTPTSARRGSHAIRSRSSNRSRSKREREFDAVGAEWRLTWMRTWINIVSGKLDEATTVSRTFVHTAQPLRCTHE